MRRIPQPLLSFKLSLYQTFIGLQHVALLSDRAHATYGAASLSVVQQSLPELQLSSALVQGVTADLADVPVAKIDVVNEVVHPTFVHDTASISISSLLSLQQEQDRPARLSLP